ncbi:MAG: LexA family transcriptional regulator [Christensenellaceae bacterium]|jgi:repressor LexA|nr:LexA family transcriptional regulator [Christensenellaceae bacterium]
MNLFELLYMYQHVAKYVGQEFNMRIFDFDLIERVRLTIERIQKEKGESPTQRELSIILDVTQPRIHRAIKFLSKEGLLEKEEKGKVVVPKKLVASPVAHIPILGEIACGEPIMVIENFHGMIDFPEDWIGAGGDVCVIRAKGDSMSGIGITDGDFLFIRLQSDAVSGDIVAAVNQEWDRGSATLKRFIKDSNGDCWLHPENEAYSDISVDGFTIIGKLIGSFKKY